MTARLLWILIGLVASGLLLAACQTGKGEEGVFEGSPSVATFSLSSGAFLNGGIIPRRYTCDGDDISPGLSWGEAPQETKGFALIVDDPDAPSRVFFHWVLYNLPGEAQSLAESAPKTERLQSGALQGRNDFGRVGYGGPCPPRGNPHRYRFQLYALDAPLDLGPGATKGQVVAQINEHIIGKAELVGIYKR